jgi:hypothetical protein
MKINSKHCLDLRPIDCIEDNFIVSKTSYYQLFQDFNYRTIDIVWDRQQVFIS